MTILVHPTRATHALPHIGVQRGDRMYHVLSDACGAAGSRELVAAVTTCGLRPEWIQYRGTYREHFDVHLLEVIECLLAHGAQAATNREVGVLLAAKRSRAAQPCAPSPAPDPETP